MWLALVFFCTSNDVMSCQSYANADELYLTESACIINVVSASLYITSEYQPMYIKPSCIKLGNTA